MFLVRSESHQHRSSQTANRMAQIDPKQSVQETNFWDADIIIDIATGAQEHEKQNSCLSGRLGGVLIRHERQLSIVLRPAHGCMIDNTGFGPLTLRRFGRKRTKLHYFICIVPCIWAFPTRFHRGLRLVSYTGSTAGTMRNDTQCFLASLSGAWMELASCVRR